MATEAMVRIGELTASRTPGDVLVSIGLGSCIGLALLDPPMTVAGLAHIMLPASPYTEADSPGKYADLAVPALVAEVERRGARRAHLEAVLVGGARMFSFNSGAGLDIGARNEVATREALADLEIPVRCAATGGTNGRTVRVLVEEAAVFVRESGTEPHELYRSRFALEPRES